MSNTVLKRAIVKVIGVASLVAFASPLLAASFDCEKARIVTEKKICSSPELSALDDQLNTLYVEVRGLVSDKEALKKEQLFWLKHRRNGCSTNLCRTAAYEFQLDELSRIKKQILSKESPAIKKIAPKYRLKPHQSFDDLYDNGVCHAMLEVINTVPYEKIYKDVFLDILNGRDGFQPIGWELIEDGEKRFWPVIVEKTLMREKPEDIEGHIAAFSAYKEKRGGFSYYLGRAMIYRDDIKIFHPVLLFKAKKLSGIDKRLDWDFIVLNDDLSGPSEKIYNNPGNLSPTYFKHLFKYKNLYFRFDSSRENLMSVLEFTQNENAVCGYELLK